VAQEKFTFESWINVRLVPRGLFVEDLFRDLRSGVLLAHLAEVRDKFICVVRREVMYRKKGD